MYKIKKNISSNEYNVVFWDHHKDQEIKNVIAKKGDYGFLKDNGKVDGQRLITFWFLDEEMEYYSINFFGWKTVSKFLQKVKDTNTLNKKNDIKINYNTNPSLNDNLENYFYWSEAVKNPINIRIIRSIRCHLNKKNLTLNDLTSFTKESLLAIPNLGKVCMEKIFPVYILAKGLKLKEGN